MRTKSCPHCTQEILVSALRCRYCKEMIATPEQVKTCPSCKTESFVDVVSCAYCGSDFSGENSTLPRPAEAAPAPRPDGSSRMVFWISFLYFWGGLSTAAAVLPMSPEILPLILCATGAVLMAWLGISFLRGAKLAWRISSSLVWLGAAVAMLGVPMAVLLAVSEPSEGLPMVMRMVGAVGVSLLHLNMLKSVEVTSHFDIQVVHAPVAI